MIRIERGGLLLLERYVADRANRYRGFDGIAWPGNLADDIELVDGLAPLSELAYLLYNRYRKPPV